MALCFKNRKRYLRPMQQADLVIYADWIVPVDAAQSVFTEHGIVITEGLIVAIVDATNGHERYAPRRVVRLPHHALVPGFINAHTHAAMTLLRGFADDMPLHDWLNNYIWPTEQRWVSPEFVRAGTNLAMAEMIAGGTTCFNDMYFFPDVVAACAQQYRMRAAVGLIVLDFPSPWAQSADEYLQRGTELHDELRHSSTVTTSFAPHAPYTVSDEPLTRIRVLADELDLPVHMHVHETATEVDESVARYGVRPLERLSRLGLLAPRMQAAHMTQLLPAEIESIASMGINVVHCPESNLKLASGFCATANLLAAGVNVALGTDGAASNNDLDMLGEMRTAALLAKGVSGDPTALPAYDALAMATINGARALGIDDITGSLEIGKSADVVAIDLSAPSCQPLYEPVTQIVYNASRDQVTNVWVAGELLLEDRGLTTIDIDEVLSDARHWSDKLRRSRTGAEPQ